jgi:hypothetical protein
MGLKAMDRREHLKLLLATPFGVGLLQNSAVTAQEQEESRRIIAEEGEYRRGYTPEELERNRRLKQKTFFNKHERRTVEVLSDLIMPADDVSGSATDAGVPQFIEFIMKDHPPFQLPVRGGLMWLDRQCRAQFGGNFIECSKQQQKKMLDQIAFPDDAEPGMEYGVRFFNRMRDLVSTGFFTSKVGFEDLDYQGNTSTVWDGVPDKVLKAHGMKYDKKTLQECVRLEERGKVAEWDEQGRLIR